MLHDFHNAIVTAVSLTILFIGGNYTKVTDVSDARRLTPKLSSTLDQLHINFCTMRFQGERGQSKAPIAVLKWFSHVPQLPILRRLVIKAYTSDAKVAAHLFSKAKQTLLTLVLNYVGERFLLRHYDYSLATDNFKGNIFTNLEGARQLKSVWVLCIASRLGEVADSLKKLEDVPLEEIHLHIPLCSETDSLEKLKPLDDHIHAGHFSQLHRMDLHMVQTRSLVEGHEINDGECEQAFESQAQEVMRYCIHKSILRFRWLPEYERGLDDVFRREMSEKFLFS
ncbi:uncharacterized protein ARMOST_04513 [Armillaria ostoyae]|uniref:Uncharacterized protein n=1 Tax=Armillaria ostoyae TaxID=47428 RepID=A0A284QXQ5_ARMOS|nr:uncharacterized protein ARMOST_04513 [Armillaria ostoyae]